jgi:hypothetical protein
MTSLIVARCAQDTFKQRSCQSILVVVDRSQALAPIPPDDLPLLLICRLGRRGAEIRSIAVPDCMLFPGIDSWVAMWVAMWVACWVVLSCMGVQMCGR